MSRRLPRASAWLVLVAVAALVACGTDTGPGSGQDDDTGTSVTDAPTGPAATPTLPRSDELIDPHPVTWSSWRALGPTELEFTITAGPADCYAVRPEVDETASEVRVELLVGRTPEAADRECPDIALESLVRVRLTSPLDGRDVRPLT